MFQYLRVYLFTELDANGFADGLLQRGVGVELSDEGADHFNVRHFRAAKFLGESGQGLAEAALQSLDQDTDVNWRPRVPQWPAIGDTMATAIQAALVGQKKPKEALDEAQQKIDGIMKS